jgi:DNA modification methylase
LRDDAFRSGLGLDKGLIPASWVQDASDWPEEKRRRFVIVDNASFGEFDLSLLANEWTDLPLIDLGVDLPADWLSPSTEGTADAEPQIDRAEELNKVWRVTLGDLWQIGEHRLLCGDSTKKEDVARVMGGEKADMVFTDPPYGLGKDIANDGDEWADVLKGAVSLFDEGSWLYVFCASSPRLWKRAWDIIKPDRVAIWHKPWNMSHPSHGFAYHFEPILIHAGKAKPQANLGDVISCEAIWRKDDPENEAHPTQKPIKLFMMLLEAAPKGSVYDPFIGSGTTMIAAENLKRRCFGIELSVDFCACILQRMTDAFPGIEIRRL